MSSRLLSAAAAALLLAAAVPALAQEAAPPAAAAAPAPDADDDDAASAAEADLEAKGEAFGARMEAMSQEMTAAVAAAGADKDKAKVDLDAIQARYQPDADAFADTLLAFVQSQMAQVPEDQRAGMAAAIPEIGPRIKGVPAEVRAGIEAKAAAPASTAPDATTPSATPPAS